MSRTTIAVVDSKRLLAVFGPRDQHLRRIRSALGVGVAARDDAIQIEGDEAAVQRAAEVFEGLDQVARRSGVVTEADVDRLLNAGTPGGGTAAAEPIEVQRPGGHVIPRSTGQAAYVRAIRDHDVVFCEGPAGCGKTFLAVAMAVSALRSEQVTKIVLVRPAVEAGESLGFLPGDLQAKINPYLRPLLDALREMMDFDLLKKLTEQDVIEMIPLAYMRGRTLNNAFIILDEAQNTTAAQMKMFLTRLGVGSKMVISGDTTQIDLPPNRRSGLIDAMHRLEGVTGCRKISLGGADIVRHPLVQRIVEAYEE
ncbi:MAG: PhoH family protein [Planctomycetia bacterium]|jgi:phosphate starvation-inducible PhoH-like protein|nr:PhoH family protein [Planctomycetia bacterium]NDH92966.1 PhoH family protein [Planctomycetia bacterium]